MGQLTTKETKARFSGKGLRIRVDPQPIFIQLSMKDLNVFFFGFPSHLSLNLSSPTIGRSRSRSRL